MSNSLQVEGASEEIGEEVHQKWVGKDFYNPFIRDFVELEQPFKGTCMYMYIAPICHPYRLILFQKYALKDSYM